MHRELFHIPIPVGQSGGVTVHSYGFMMVLALVAAMIIARLQARREGVPPEAIMDLGLIGMVSGVLGSRIAWFFVFRRPDPDLDWGATLLDLVAIWRGGLVFYGGLVLGVIACSTYVFLQYRGWDTGETRFVRAWGRTADCFAPGLAAGLAFGRIGCFLNGCCFGAVCEADAWYCVRFPHGSPAWTHHLYNGLIDETTASSLPVHASQLYASACGLVIAAALLVFYRRRRFPGQVLLLFVMLYAAARFFLEYTRGDTRLFWEGSPVGGLKAGQIGAIFTFICASGLTAWLWKRAAPTSSADADRKEPT